jgi:hypothetical protein
MIIINNNKKTELIGYEDSTRYADGGVEMWQARENNPGQPYSIYIDPLKRVYDSIWKSQYLGRLLC